MAPMNYIFDRFFCFKNIHFTQEKINLASLSLIFRPIGKFKMAPMIYIFFQFFCFKKFFYFF